MTILFLTNDLGGGGKERQIIEILTFLTKATQNKYVLLLRENRIAFQIAGLSNLKIIKPQKRLSFLKFILFQKKVINEFRPDIIHSWEGMVTLSAIIVRLFSGRKFKIINASIQYARKYSFYTKTFLIIKLNALLADMVVANSKAGLFAAGFQKKRKYHVLPNCFDLSQFSRYKAKGNMDGNLQIAMVASFTAAKDFKSVVHSAVSLIGAGLIFKIIFIGEGPEREAVERSIPDIYKSCFVFTGYLPTKEVLELLSKIDIGILVSKKGHSEGMSNSIMEYMIFGIPVICTATGGNPELIINEYNGFLIPHEDTSMLTEKLKILLTDENKRIVMGHRSKKIAYEEFAIEKVSKKFLTLYNLLLKE